MDKRKDVSDLIIPEGGFGPIESIALFPAEPPSRFKELIKDLNYEDDDGNDISCSQSGRLTLVLFQGEEASVRKQIGTIFDTRDGIVYRKKVSFTRHLFRVANAWAICASIAEVLKKYDAVIEFCTKAYTYRISADEACEGGWQWFKHQGYERQRLIPLDKWEKVPAG